MTINPYSLHITRLEQIEMDIRKESERYNFYKSDARRCLREAKIAKATLERKKKALIKERARIKTQAKKAALRERGSK